MKLLTDFAEIFRVGWAWSIISSEPNRPNISDKSIHHLLHNVVNKQTDQ